MVTEKKSVVEDFAEEMADLVKNDDGTYSTGSDIRVKLKAVSAGLISTLQERIEDPVVPTVELEDGREVQNPNDPTFVRALAKADSQRSQVVFDAFLMFGVELVDGLPEDEKWIDELAFLGIEIDKTSDISKEFAYKKHVLGSSGLIFKIAEMSGVSSAQIKAAKRSFQGNS